MSDATSDAERGVPVVILDTARVRIQARVQATIALGLAIVLFCQAALLGALARQAPQRVYVPDTTLITSFSPRSGR